MTESAMLGSAAALLASVNTKTPQLFQQNTSNTQNKSSPALFGNVRCCDTRTKD